MNFSFIFLHISFRYIAVSHPHYYRDINARMNPMKRVLCYAVPVTTFSILVNIPKFLETEVSTVSKIYYLLTYLYRHWRQTGLKSGGAEFETYLVNLETYLVNSRLMQ